MEEPVFKTKRVGLVGGRPVGHEYMARINLRAKQLKQLERPKKLLPGEEKQMMLPGVKR